MFQKYRVSLWLKKCYFLKYRIEYVYNDVTDQVNRPTQTKFYLINDWGLPKNGQARSSFIELVNFYHQYAPYF